MAYAHLSVVFKDGLNSSTGCDVIGLGSARKMMIDGDKIVIKTFSRHYVC